MAGLPAAGTAAILNAGETPALQKRDMLMPEFDLDEVTRNDHDHEPHLIKFAGRGESETKLYSAAEFMAATGVVYLPQLEFQDERVREIIRMQCSRALQIGTIGKDSRWLGALHAKDIRDHHIADVSIRWIDETIGYGLFADKEIAAWEFIGEYTGLVRKLNLIFGNINEYCFGYPTSAFSFKKHVIDASKSGNETRYMNHSDSPNSESMAVLCDGMLHIMLRATQNIPADSEIRYDYTGSYRMFKRLRAYIWNRLKHWPQRV